jgi:RNA polymerase sigma-70 factor, ECF subfamily
LTSTPRSDEELLADIAAGQQAAVAQLYDRYQRLVYGMATRMTGDRALAEDVLQEVFLAVWRNAGRFAPERASARTWILSIAHHRAIDFVRRRRPVVELPGEEAAPAAALTSADPWPEVSRGLDADAVRGALARVPGAQREVIELAYFAGLTQVEIAERTGAPLGTVKSRARLALEQLRRALADQMRETSAVNGDAMRETSLVRD